MPTTIARVRAPLRVTWIPAGLAALWLVGAWPLLLLVLHWRDPEAAVHFQAHSELWLARAGWTALLAALLLAVVYPPFVPAIRYSWNRLLARLRAERTPLRQARAELRGFESAPRHLDAGRAALAAHEFEAALAHLQRSLELEPGQVAASYLQGTALLALDRPREAVAPLQRAVELDPAHAFGGAMLLLGRAQMCAGDHARAAEVLTRHSREHGGNRKSHFWLGQCRLKLGDARGARQAFEVAAAAPPPRPRLTAEEAYYRARARTALWTVGGAGPAGGDA